MRHSAAALSLGVSIHAWLHNLCGMSSTKARFNKALVRGIADSFVRALRGVEPEQGINVERVRHQAMRE